MMNDSIISAIDDEIQRLENAKALLLTTTGDKFLKHRTATAKKAAKRVLSPEARKRIADAQRRRWAAVKKGKTA